MDFGPFIPYAVTFGLVSLRCLAMFMLIPVFGGKTIPKTFRAGVAVVVGLTLTAIAGPLPYDGPLFLILAALGEMLMGLAMGLVVRIILAIGEMAGEVAGLQMGFAFNRLVDPMTQENKAVSARLFSLIAGLLFLSIDGHHLVIAGLGESVRRIPPGHVLARVQYLGNVIPVLSVASVTALRVAAPVMIALLLTNASIGLIARAAPQLNLFILAFGFAIGLGMLMMSMSAWPSFTLMLQQLRQLPQYLAPVLGG